MGGLRGLKGLTTRDNPLYLGLGGLDGLEGFKGCACSINGSHFFRLRSNFLCCSLGFVWFAWAEVFERIERVFRNF